MTSPASWFVFSLRVVYLMGRWPDNSRSTLVTFALIFILFPLLAWLCVWFMRG